MTITAISAAPSAPTARKVATFESIVTSVGRAEMKRDAIAATVVESAGPTFDWTARGAIATAIRNHGGWDVETCPARKRGPKGAQVTTTFGVGFQALEDAIRKIVTEKKEATPGVLRVTLSGEGGGSATIPADHPLYAALVEMIGQS